MLGPLLSAAAAAGIAAAITVPTSGVSKAEFTNGIQTSIALSKTALGPLYLENWSGATKAGTGINKITGRVNVPDWRNREDGFTSGIYMAVRLDGLPPCNKDSPLASIWQATNKNGDGWGDLRANNFRAQWSWGDYSGGSENVLTFPLRVGDEVQMELIVLSPTSINGTIKNLNTGQETYRIIGNDNGFCGLTANWIVASYVSLGRPMPLTDFVDNITWTGASAVTATGETLNLEGARVMDINQTWEADPSQGPVQGGLQTDCNIVNDSTVTCKRLRPSPPSGRSQ